MLKAKQLVYGVTTKESISNGQLFILTKQRAHKLKDSIKTSVSMSTDHSILFLNFHSIELLSVLVLTMLYLRDGEITTDLNNGSLTE